MLIEKWLNTLGRYLILMGRTFQRPERMRMFMKEYVKEMAQLGVNSIGIVLLISFFIGAVICIQMKLNIQSPWMPRWVTGYTTREIMLPFLPGPRRPRDYAARVLVVHHVSYPCRKGRLEHRLGDWHHEGDSAD